MRMPGFRHVDASAWEGGALALRYPTPVAPFADMVDLSVQSFAALGAIMSGSEIAVLFTPDAATSPAEFNMLLALPAARDGNPPAFLRDGVAQANVMHRRK
jgi:hypothetical protein